MLDRFVVLILSAWLLTGCACGKAGKKTERTTTSAPDSKTLQAKASERDKTATSAVEGTQTTSTGANPCQGERTTHQGEVTLQGQVGSTKGGILTLGSVFLTFSDRNEGRDWLGKSVTVTGDLCEYTCHPMEQCLSSGKISSLRNLRISEVPVSP